MRLIMQTIVTGLVAMLAGCPGPQNVQCLENGHCNRFLGGVCHLAPSENQWCSYPDSACASGLRYSDLNVGDSLSGQCVILDGGDAGIDALTDASISSTKFDVAYVNTWELGGEPSHLTEVTWGKIVNTGGQPLDLSVAEFTSVVGDDDRFMVSMALENTAGLKLSPGFSKGALSGQAYQLIVINGLATEPEQLPNGVGLIRFTITEFPFSGTWIVFNAIGTLKIGNSFVNISIKLINTGTNSMPLAKQASRIMASSL